MSEIKPKIFYLSTIDKIPLGGTKQHYRHVEILNSAGYEAYLLLSEKGLEAKWFEHKVPIIDAQTYSKLFDPGKDFTVLPEIIGRSSDIPGNKVIFNQNAYYTFKNYSFKIEHSSIYHDPRLRGVMVVSKDNKKYLDYCFPKLKSKIFNITNGVNTQVFKPAEKKKRIAFFLRKNILEVESVFNMLLQRCAALGWQFALIQNKTEKEIAEILGETTFYLHFGYPEGCPLTVMEAMASGCYVMGYEGFGGKELYDKRFSTSIPNSDVLRFAKAAEKAIKLYYKTPQQILNRGLKARNFIEKNYSLVKEKQTVLDFWQKMLAQNIK